MNEADFSTQVKPAEWQIRSLEDGKLLYFRCNLPVLPAVRQNRKSRWGMKGQRAQDYNAAKNAIGDLLCLAMQQEAVSLFPRDARLRIILTIYNGGFELYVKQYGQLALPKGSLKGDWDNLAKCVCDAMQGIVYPNDSQIDAATVEVLR